MVVAETRPEVQFQQLPSDPLVTPPGVLPTEPEDELPDLRVDTWAAGATSPLVCPLLPDELPVPPEQRLGPDHERGPQVPRQRPARCRQQDPIEAVQPRAPRLPLQHLHLVPEHQELDVHFVRRTTSASEETANDEVEERKQHGSPSERGECMLPVVLGSADRGF
jgi:hypothetical protein